MPAMVKPPSSVKQGEWVLFALFVAAVAAFVLISIGYGIMEYNGSFGRY